VVRVRWTQTWTGRVTAEALDDDALVNSLRVTAARIEDGLHHYWVETDAAGVDLVGRRLRAGPWYAHFWSGQRMVVLFQGARFELLARDAATWRPLLAHAEALGIPGGAHAFLAHVPVPAPYSEPPRLGADPDAPPAGAPAVYIDRAAPSPAGATSGPDAEAAPLADAVRPGERWAVGPVLVLVDEDVEALLDAVEGELLIPLARRIGRPPSAGPAPAALGRLREALERPVHGRVLAPNGRWVHAGLRLVPLCRADLEALHALLREASAALVAGGGPAAAAEAGAFPAALDACAASAGTTPHALTGALARLLAVLDLPPDADTAVLAEALAGPAGGADAARTADVVLTGPQEQAYQRLAHRVTMLLTESDPLHRFLLAPDQ